MVIHWNTPKVRICLLEFYGNISFNLTTMLQYDILEYVETPQVTHASMHHVMMLQQRYSNLLPMLVIQGYQCF
jgi:hypothetical protein